MSTNDIPIDNLNNIPEEPADVDGLSIANSTLQVRDPHPAPTRRGSIPAWAESTNRFGRGVQYAGGPFVRVALVAMLLVIIPYLIVTGQLFLLFGLAKGTKDAIRIPIHVLSSS
ncbi:unnamed protein product [Peniophora sp. CBMAI 1063]|nr:unnamed protein product [Peniophora sp. CBMAI 1063]